MVDFLKTLAPDLATVKGFGNDDEHRDARKNAETIQVETISLVDMLNEYSAPSASKNKRAVALLMLAPSNLISH